MPPLSEPGDWRARYERALDEAQHGVTAADRAARPAGRGRSAARTGR
ncbi:MAG: hypothetical protein H6704_09120 [Myxococcales bacterium]|nr:hypothetical protein [Myxococcales bacterium]